MADAEIEVFYGTGPTEPERWYLAGRNANPGLIRLPPQTPDTRVWTKGRQVREGYQPSPFTEPESFVYGEGTPMLTLLRVQLAADGLPTVIWEKNSFAIGVRLEWAVHAQGADPVYANSDDFDAENGHATLVGFEAAEGERVSVRAIPYTGFGGGSVSGTAGSPMLASADMDDEPEGRAFDSSFDSSWG